jgi:hypothetical protein
MGWQRPTFGKTCSTRTTLEVAAASVAAHRIRWALSRAVPTTASATTVAVRTLVPTATVDATHATIQAALGPSEIGLSWCAIVLLVCGSVRRPTSTTCNYEGNVCVFNPNEGSPATTTTIAAWGRRSGLLSNSDVEHSASGEVERAPHGGTIAGLISVVVLRVSTHRSVRLERVPSRLADNEPLNAWDGNV